MKPAECRAMSDEQLILTLKDTVKHLFHLRFQSATERLETPSEIRKAKQEIARIKTIQRERELAALSGAATKGRSKQWISSRPNRKWQRNIAVAVASKPASSPAIK